MPISTRRVEILATTELLTKQQYGKLLAFRLQSLPSEMWKRS